jgi:hypothetical protein
MIVRCSFTAKYNPVLSKHKTLMLPKFSIDANSRTINGSRALGVTDYGVPLSISSRIRS